MSPTDELIQKAIEEPDFAEQRKVLGDSLRSEGEADLADAVEGSGGAKLLRELGALAETTRLHAGVRLLWCAYHVMPRISLPGSQRGTSMTTAITDRGAWGAALARENRSDGLPDYLRVPTGPLDTIEAAAELALSRQEAMAGRLGRPISVRAGEAPQPDMSVDQYRQVAGATFEEGTAVPPRLTATPRDIRIQRDPAGEFERIYNAARARAETVATVFNSMGVSPDDLLNAVRSLPAGVLSHETVGGLIDEGDSGDSDAEGDD